MSIDHLPCSSASEILWDATLTVFYSFEGNLLDRGPLGIHGNGTRIELFNTARFGRVLGLHYFPSYVQTRYLVSLGQHNQAYSYSLWICPFQNGGTLIHLSNNQTDQIWSMPVLGLTLNNTIVAQACSASGRILLIGPRIHLMNWTHLALTYASSGILRLWVNGTEVASSTSSFTSVSAGMPLIGTIGFSPIPNATAPCAGATVSMTQLIGFVDEFQIYSRALSSSEIVALANP